MLLEAAATSEGNRPYEFNLNLETKPWTIDTRRLISQVASDVSSGCSPGNIAGCFHETVASMIETVCTRLRERTGVESVCLSGGTFQNLTLLTACVSRLRTNGFQVLLHSRVPPNDGGVSLGQAMIAATYLDRQG